MILVEGLRLSSKQLLSQLQRPSLVQRRGHQAEVEGIQLPARLKKNGAGFKWFVALVLMVLIVACGWLGLQVLQLQQHLSDNKNALQLERSRMESISAQVHETGTSFAETGNVLESKFTFFESEIRKLWDVSNKRNKKNITSNTTQLKTLSANLKKAQQGLQGELESLSNGQTKTSRSVAKLNKQLASENTALRASLEEQSEELLLMNGELEILRQRFNSIFMSWHDLQPLAARLQQDS